MSNESAEITEFIEKVIPQNILTNLKSAIKTPEDLRKILLWQEDVPHRFGHILDASNIFYWLSEATGIMQTEREIGQRFIRLHDIGYRASELGIVLPNEHHYASVYLASFIDPNLNVLEMILNHVNDRLPPNTELYKRYAKEADIVSALGPTGANRLALYFGYNGQLITSGYEQLVDNKIYCNLAKPPAVEHIMKNYSNGDPHRGYDLEAINFFFDYVFPALIKLNKVDEFGKYLNLLASRFHGQESLFIKSEHPEGISDLAKDMFSTRIRFTDVLSMAIFVHKNDYARIEKHTKDCCVY